MGCVRPWNRAAAAAAGAIVLVLVFGAPAASGGTPQAHMVGSRAVAPASAPPEVKAMLRAGNRIRHKPYLWGGGHRHWRARGYDCSGSVSFILHAAGLLDYPLDSTGFMHWGRQGNNRWVRIYANHEHVFAIVDGLRWDTSYITDGDRSGPGWSETMRPIGGFHLRHPTGSAGW